jgi:uncharacterized protein (TIGR02284 family)
MAEKGDDAAKEVFTSALKEDLPLPLRELLQRQLTHIQRSHDRIKALHDLRALD